MIDGDWSEWSAENQEKFFKFILNSFKGVSSPVKAIKWHSISCIFSSGVYYSGGLNMLDEIIMICVGEFFISGSPWILLLMDFYFFFVLKTMWSAERLLKNLPPTVLHSSLFVRSVCNIGTSFV